MLHSEKGSAHPAKGLQIGFIAGYCLGLPILLRPILPSIMYATGYRIALIGALTIFAFLLSNWLFRDKSQKENMIFSLLLAGGSFYFAALQPGITNYPFSLTWSETSRYYIASQFFAKDIYQQDIFPYGAIGRYLTLGFPFLWPGLSIGYHRAWLALLTSGLTFLTAFLLVRDIELEDERTKLAVTLWGGIFILQAPVYYQLLPIAAFVFWGFYKKNIYTIVVGVLLATLWSDVVRFTWSIMPGFLFALLYLFNFPIKKGGKAWDKIRYFLFPGGIFIATIMISSISNLGNNTRLWLYNNSGVQVLSVNRFGVVVGIAVIVAAIILLQKIPPPSKKQIAWFTRVATTLSFIFIVSVLTISFERISNIHIFITAVNIITGEGFANSAMLWERLLPNPSYPPGILLAGLAISAFPIILIAKSFKLWKGKIETARLLAISIILAGLFAEGIVISAKIGGGLDLHNLDAYFVALMCVTAFTYFGRIRGIDNQTLPLYRPQWLTAGLVVIPLISMVIGATGRIEPLTPEANYILSLMTEEIETAAAEGDVLFLSQRHLVTFGYFENVTNVDDYEKLQLMEMTMRMDMDYLGEFEKQLANHAYAMIVTDPLRFESKEPETAALAAESNIYTELVVKVIDCYYEQSTWYQKIGVQLWVPSDTPCK